MYRYEPEVINAVTSKPLSEKSLQSTVAQEETVKKSAKVLNMPSGSNASGARPPSGDRAQEEPAEEWRSLRLRFGAHDCKPAPGQQGSPDNSVFTGELTTFGASFGVGWGGLFSTHGGCADDCC